MSLYQMVRFLKLMGCGSTALAFAFLAYCMVVKRVIHLLRWVIVLGLIGAACLYQYAKYVPLIS